MISVSAFSALLFAIGVVSTAACCLHIAIHASIARNGGLSVLDTAASRARETTSETFTNPLSVERYAFVISVVTLVATVMFGVLDLAGMIVHRSSIWRMSLRSESNTKGGGIYDQSGGWHAASPLDLPSKLIGGSSGVGYHADWPYYANENVYTYGMASRQPPLAWWRRWVLLEELVFGIRRNMGFIRLSIALLLALVWSPAIVQVAIVGYTGQCHVSVSGDSSSVAGGARAAGVATLNVCDLLRKALITSVFIWATWSFMALLLLFVNTTSAGMRANKHLLPYHTTGDHPSLAVGGVVPNVSSAAGVTGASASANAPIPYSISGAYQGNGALFASKRNSNIGNALQVPGHMPYNQGLFHPYQQIHHPYASAAPSTTGPKESSNAQYRASWSHTDGGESVASDLSKLEAQSIFHSQNNKANMVLQQSQPNTLHQLYHLQAHPFHSLNQFQPPSRISEEQQPEGAGDLYGTLPSSLALAYSSAQRKARAAFYKTKYSTSISGMADPLVNTAGSSAVYAATSSTANGADAAGEKRISRDGGGARRHYKLQYRHHGGGPPLPPGIASSSGSGRGAAAAGRSLARLSYESCDGALAIASLGGGGTSAGGGIGGGGWRSSSDSKTKRNTIG
ncbi:hypothetical protein IW138_001255 [Coemansia sp. RSA 986]|nr:hypothetical protein IW138_001255 [Coemansia sp. RSA 986]